MSCNKDKSSSSVFPTWEGVLPFPHPTASSSCCLSCTGSDSLQECSLASQKTDVKRKKKGEVDIFFSCKVSELNWLTGVSDELQGWGGGWTTWPEPGTAQPGQERKKGNKEVGKYFTYSVNSTYLISSTDQNNCSCLALTISAYSLSSFSQFLLISKPFTAGVVHNLVGGL